jgi:MATE family multidrug resistance protein
MDVEGVALATVLAEYFAVLVGIGIIWPTIKEIIADLMLHELLATGPLLRMLRINRDIMVRTLCLIFAFAWFTDQGARSGDTILAANMLLMQFVTFAAFFLDGFALAAESLVGQAVGARDTNRTKHTIRITFELGVASAFALSLLFGFTCHIFLSLLTSNEEVVTTANVFSGWIIVAPVISVSSYLLDGVFIGAALTREMRQAMIFSLGVFLMACWVLVDTFANNGLWAALMIYYLTRAASLAYFLPKAWADRTMARTD